MEWNAIRSAFSFSRVKGERERGCGRRQREREREAEREESRGLLKKSHTRFVVWILIEKDKKQADGKLIGAWK